MYTCYHSNFSVSLFCHFQIYFTLVMASGRRSHLRDLIVFYWSNSMKLLDLLSCWAYGQYYSWFRVTVTKEFLYLRSCAPTMPIKKKTNKKPKKQSKSGWKYFRVMNLVILQLYPTMVIIDDSWNIQMKYFSDIVKIAIGIYNNELLICKAEHYLSNFH